jgi:hypothetical protein
LGNFHFKQKIIINVSLNIFAAAPRAVHLEFDGRRLSPTPLMSASSPSSRVTYREKDNASIQCVVEGGNPPPRVYWFLNSRNLTNQSQMLSESVEDSKLYITRSTLRMDNISRSENNKSVLCVVDHELLTTANDEPSYLRAMAQFNIECKSKMIFGLNNLEQQHI